MGEASGGVSGGYSGPTEYELWRDSLMIAATAVQRFDGMTALGERAAEVHAVLCEGAPGRTDFLVQYRELHVEWRMLVDQVTAALAIHHPCHSVHPWKTVEDACERSHYEPAETPECIGCGYGSSDQPTAWPCATAQALGVTMSGSEADAEADRG